MVHSLVERATSDMLIGPDWAMNLEICDILNHDPGQAKDIVRGLRKRIGHKNPKIQLLALTLLETIIKNCGDIVHMHVAEKDVLHEMVKIVKKKPDVHVREKILVLIDTWQEAFGGARARYPQFCAAHQELLRAGAVFPERSESAAPIFTPAQTQPLASYPQNLRNTELRQETAESVSELTNLSLAEIQNAHGIMDVLAEMLNALDPGSKEGLRQEVIVDLVEQCRSYKERVVQLVNKTADEDLLYQGLKLNDDLQRVLAKHDAITFGTAIGEKKGKSLQALVDVGDAENSGPGNERSTSNAGAAIAGQSPLQQLALPAPSSNGTSSALVKVDTNIDLLSGDFSPPTAKENELALVPVSQATTATTTSSASQMDMILLSDMFPQNNTGTMSSPSVSLSFNLVAMQPFPTPPQQPNPSQTGIYSNGSLPNPGQQLLYGQGSYVQGPPIQDTGLNIPPWNDQIAHSSSPTLQQQSGSFGTNVNDGALPPPPWETQVDSSQQMPVAQYPNAVESGQPPTANAASQPPIHVNTGSMYMTQSENSLQPETHPQQPMHNIQQFPPPAATTGSQPPVHVNTGSVGMTSSANGLQPGTYPQQPMHNIQQFPPPVATTASQPPVHVNTGSMYMTPSENSLQPGTHPQQPMQNIQQFLLPAATTASQPPIHVNTGSMYMASSENGLQPGTYPQQPMHNIQQFPSPAATTASQPPVHVNTESMYMTPSENSLQPGTHSQQPMHNIQQFPPSGTYPGPMPSNIPVAMYTQPTQGGQTFGVYTPSIQRSQVASVYPHQMQGSHAVGPMGMYPQIPSVQPGGFASMYPAAMQGGQLPAYSYGQQSNTDYLDQKMYGLSMQDDNRYNNSSHAATSYIPPKKSAKPEDKLFGDLLDIAKSKSNKPSTS